MDNLTAKATITVNAPVAVVWDALTNPTIITQYMFGAEVVSDWHEGSRIIWKGIWNEKPYEDHGVILKIAKESLLQYTHFSPLTGQPDLPENYHTVTTTLTSDGTKTTVTILQDGNQSEEARAHSEKNWGMMLSGLKKVIEKQ